MRCIHIPCSTSSRPACDIIEYFGKIFRFLFLVFEVPHIEAEPKVPTDSAIALALFIYSAKTKTRPYVDFDIQYQTYTIMRKINN